METFLIMLGLLLCGIIITVSQILIAKKREVREIEDLFEESTSS